MIIVYPNHTAEVTKSITLKSSTPVNIRANREVFCTPSLVNFNVNSNPSFTNFQWNFGDSSPSQSSATTLANHQFQNFGNFTVTVTATNTNGCKTTDTKLISINPISITGSFTIGDGCSPVTNSFQSTVTTPQGSTINNYQWNFGDGTSISNNIPRATHTYPAGDFIPQLTVTTIDGCSSTFFFDSVHYGRSPVNLQTHPEQIRFCGNLNALFFAKADYADRYEWNFGFGSRISTADTFITHKFSSLGTKTISVTPYYHNCPGQTQTFQVTVIGTIAKFNFENTCTDKRTFTFTNTCAGTGLQYLWDFGHNTPGSSISEPVHTYPRSGNFPTSLISIEPISGCKDTATTTIYTAVPNLINAHNDICVHTNTKFRMTNGYRNNSAVFNWNLMGLQSFSNSDTIISINADSLGRYENKVIISNGNSYCPDTIALNHYIVVKGPHADFSSENSFCVAQPLAVLNATTTYFPNDTISKYSWDYGDGNNMVYGTHPQPYQYGQQGTYIVKLIAADINGCMDTVIKQVIARPMPFLWLIPHHIEYCLGGSDSLIAYTSDSLIWRTTSNLQNFCNTCDTNFVTPQHSTQFYATATNQFHCSTSDSSYVKIFEPFVAAPTIRDTTICENSTLQLAVYPNDKQIIWSPPNGLNSTIIYNPVLTPSQSRMYTAQLIDSLGCYSNSIQINVKIKSNPKVELGENRYLPFDEPITLTPNYSQNIRNFEWTPASLFSCNNCPNPTINLIQRENISLKVVSDSGCTATDNFTLAVACSNAYLLMPTAFSPDNDGRNDIIYPFSRGIKHIKKFMVYNRSGQLMFQKMEFSPNEKSYGWDGKYQGIVQPAGTYVYFIEALCELGETTEKKGSFILIR